MKKDKGVKFIVEGSNLYDVTPRYKGKWHKEADGEPWYVVLVMFIIANLCFYQALMILSKHVK